jgi:hypothetical protein
VSKCFALDEACSDIEYRWSRIALRIRSRSLLAIPIS